MYNLLDIVTMWNKVNELSRQSYSQAQIAQLLGVHRDTVRRYQSMSEKEFNDHLVREIRRHPSKLDPYRQFITDELRLYKRLYVFTAKNQWQLSLQRWHKGQRDIQDEFPGLSGNRFGV